MTNNETIARWLGLDIQRGYVWKSVPMPCPDSKPGCCIAHYAMKPFPLPQYDADIILWHGKDGLLAEIEKRGDCWKQFLCRIAVLMGFAGEHWTYDQITMEEIWMIRRMESAQLAAALVAIIDGGDIGSEQCRV